MLRFALLLVFCATSGLAQGKAERAAAFFQGWIAEQGVDGALVVMKGHLVEAVADHGRSSNEPVEMASLSKAITALCAEGLVREGKLNWDDTAHSTLGQGPEVSLAELVTHAGGVWPDGTQGLRGVARFYSGEDAAGVAKRIRNRALQDKTFRYNNENYALISLMITAASGESYEQACRTRVLAPAGVQDARPSPVTGASLAWGGWQMSVQDYAKFHSYWFGIAGLVRTQAKELPSVQIGAAQYGLGAFYRGSVTDRAYWHFGGLCIPGKLRAGAFVATYGSGWTVVAAYDACLNDERALALSQGLTGILAE